ncbi:MAG: peptidase M61, partial [Allosphingosinicella sp.]
MPLLTTRLLRTGLAVGGPVLCIAAAVAAAAASPSPAPGLHLLLRPVPGADGEVVSVDVTLVLDDVRADPATPLVQLPLVVANVETVAASVDSVEAHDARGPLRLTARVEGTGASEVRSWLTDRPVEGPVSLTYRAPISGRVASRGAAPPLELRAEAGAFSGAGSTFLLLPVSESLYRLSVRWDMAAMPGAEAASSLGPGDVALATPQPASRFERSFFMAGRIGRFPEPRSPEPFFAAWQGTPPFDGPALMQWTGDLHRQYVALFRPPEVLPYGVFLRPNPVNAGGGVGLIGSFVATYGPGTDPEELKLTLAHEMFHTFAPAIGNPGGLESSWFGEGLAVFYARRLALRFGQIGPDAFLDDLNSHAGRDYTSLMAAVPNSEIPARFWADTRVRTLPYDRGSLYFAMVDDQLRESTHDLTSLDDLMLEMVARGRDGRTLSNTDWEEVLVHHLGVNAVAEFRNMLTGNVPLPDSDAF